MNDDTMRAVRQYAGWTVTDVVTLDEGVQVLEVTSPDGDETTLVSLATATYGSEE